MSAEECRQRMSELIEHAIPEQDPERRQALLVMADHWGELLRLRKAPENDRERVSSGHPNGAST